MAVSNKILNYLISVFLDDEDWHEFVSKILDVCDDYVDSLRADEFAKQFISIPLLVDTPTSVQLPKGTYKIMTEGVYFEDGSTIKNIDGVMQFASELSPVPDSVVVMNVDFAPDSYLFRMNDVRLPFALSSYYNMMLGNCLKGNTLDDIEFINDFYTAKYYKIKPVFINRNLFYSPIKLFPYKDSNFKDVLVVDDVEYPILTYDKGIASIQGPISADEDSDIHIERHIGSYSPTLAYKGFTSLPENIQEEVFEALPMVLLPEYLYYAVSISPTVLKISGVQQLVKFNVYGNDSYHINSDESWITSLPVDSLIGNNVIPFNVSKNEGDEPRTGVINITPTYAKPLQLTVIQRVVDFEAEFNPSSGTLQPGISVMRVKAVINTDQQWRLDVSPYKWMSTDLTTLSVLGRSIIEQDDDGYFLGTGSDSLSISVRNPSFDRELDNNVEHSSSESIPLSIKLSSGDSIVEAIYTLKVVCQAYLSITLDGREITSRSYGSLIQTNSTSRTFVVYVYSNATDELTGLRVKEPQGTTVHKISSKTSSQHYQVWNVVIPVNYGVDRDIELQATVDDEDTFYPITVRQKASDVLGEMVYLPDDLWGGYLNTSGTIVVIFMMNLSAMLYRSGATIWGRFNTYGRTDYVWSNCTISVNQGSFTVDEYGTYFPVQGLHLETIPTIEVKLFFSTVDQRLNKTAQPLGDGGTWFVANEQPFIVNSRIPTLTAPSPDSSNGETEGLDGTSGEGAPE